MPRSRSSSGRVRALLALPFFAIVLAGCGTSGTGTSTTSVTATGSTLHVYLSDPSSVSSDQSLQDVVDAEKLAWTQQSPQLSNIAVKLTPLIKSISDNARTAIGDDSAIAYLGEIQQGDSRQTVGITNAEDLLELSPSDQVNPDKNDFESFSSYGRTFASLPLQLTTSASALNQADPQFAKSFKASFGHAPSANAILGYSAVWTLVRVIRALKGNANSRSKITTDVIATLEGNKGTASVPAFKIILK